MKINKSFIPALLCPLMLAGCADWDDWNYDVEKPQTIAEYEYLNDYSPIKEYLDRSAHPNFKVGVALAAADYNNQGPLFRLAAHNFDEIVAGNAMKMASCVNDQGAMDFGTVTSFVSNAEQAGLTVYGHTLAWHEQQPKKWLEKLLADKELDIDPNEKIERELKTQSYEGLTKFPFFVMGYEPEIINGVLTSNCSDWHQYFVIDGISGLEEGQTYKVSAMIRASKEHTINVQFGNWGQLAEAKMKVGTEWKECSVEFQCPPTATGFSVFQPGVFDGTIEIQWVKVSKLETPAMEVEQEVKYQTYTDGPFPYYPMGCEPPVVNGCIHFVPTGDWSQFFCLPGGENPLTPGEYAVYVEIKSSKAGSVKLTVQNGWGGDAENFTGNVALKEGWTTSSFRMKLEQGGNYDMILKPETFDATLDLKSITIKKIVKMNSIPLTPEEKKDTLVWAMNKWCQGMIQATQGKVKAWDLINEAVSGGGNVHGGIYALHSETNVSPDDAARCFYWQDYFSPEEYGPIVEKAARDAYASVEGANPSDLLLFVNDYNLESDWDQNHKVKSLVEWIKIWEAKGKELGWNTKIDGIGTQMHISYYENEQIQQSKKNAIENMFKIMAASGKLVRVSELDMGYVDANGKTVTTEMLQKLPIAERLAKEKAMGDFYKWIIQKYFEIVPTAQQYGITQWCITDSPADSGWRKGEPVGLWTIDYQRKPAYAGFAEGIGGK